MGNLPKSNTELDQIIAFLGAIGLRVREQELPENCVLPGISIDAGILLVDRKKLLYPGDLLHEAGHRAVVPGAERVLLSVNVGDEGGMEMGAIAWSYAAVVAIGLPSGHRNIRGFTKERSQPFPALIIKLQLHLSSVSASGDLSSVSASGDLSSVSASADLSCVAASSARKFPSICLKSLRPSASPKLRNIVMTFPQYQIR